MKIQHTESMSRCVENVHAARREQSEMATLERALHREANRWRWGDTVFVLVLMGFALVCWIGVFGGVKWLIVGRG